MTVKCVLVIFCSALALSEATVAGFYSDNGVGQSVTYHTLPKRERKEMQQEILSLLGLHHRPNPASHGSNFSSFSAPRYMLDLYETLSADEEDIYIETAKKRYLRQEVVDDRAMLENTYSVQEADTIMSFVNQGMAFCTIITVRAQHLQHLN